MKYVVKYAIKGDSTMHAFFQHAKLRLRVIR